MALAFTSVVFGIRFSRGAVSQHQSLKSLSFIGRFYFGNLYFYSKCIRFSFMTTELAVKFYIPIFKSVLNR